MESGPDQNVLEKSVSEIQGNLIKKIEFDSNGDWGFCQISWKRYYIIKGVGGVMPFSCKK